MERIELESFWLTCPLFADELVGRETLEGLEAPAEIVGVDEVGEMASQLIMIVIVISLDSRILNCAVHALDLAIGRHALILRAELGGRQSPLSLELNDVENSPAQARWVGGK